MKSAMRQHRFRAFRMRHHFGARMRHLRIQPARRAGNVACTMQAPCQIFMFSRPVCSLHVVAEVAVGQEQHGLLRAEWN